MSDDMLEEGAELLRSLRKEPASIAVTAAQRKRLLQALGTTEYNVDELLSLPTASSTDDAASVDASR